MAPTSRTVAATALTQVIVNGKTLDPVLIISLERLPDLRDRAFAQELVYGVLRWYWNLLPQLKQLLHRPLRQRDRDIEMLLLIGLYQLRYLSTPTHAAVAATVSACDGLNKAWAKGLINATLRNAIRLEGNLAAAAMDSISARTAHPQWFVTAVQRDWPEDWQSILTANNEHPPCTLRVNQQQHGRDEYLGLLRNDGLEARITRYSQHGIVLEKPAPVGVLPDFENGGVSVQDEAAQLATTLLDLPNEGRVLDACAAPGGKTAHILESCLRQVEVVAIDRSEYRVTLLKDTLQRLGLNAAVYIGDTNKMDDWWDGVPFDRILLDAPCSGSGVIRRHPDIKIHRRWEDIDRLAEQQIQLLNSLWPLLRPRGKLVYVTCSILKAENDGIISRFIKGTDNIRLDRFDVDWGVATECGQQIISGDGGMDGFYYARMVKEQCAA